MKHLLAIILTSLSLFASDKESVIEVTKANQADVLKNEYLVLDVYADWCTPCKNFKPVFEDVASEGAYKKYAFAKANIDGDSGIADQFKVSSVPTIIFIKNGKELNRVTGYMSHEKLKAKIQTIFAEPASAS